MIRAIVPLADGVEEIEAVAIIDTLRRAGWDIVGAGVKPGPVTASRGVRLMPDAAWDDLDIASFEALVIPGGAEGTAALCRDERVLRAVRDFMAGDRIVGAICAGPLVLQSAGVLDGRNLTCYPGVGLMQGNRSNDRVVVDRNLVTSQGPGTALEFALALAGLADPAKAREVAAALLMPG